MIGGDYGTTFGYRGRLGRAQYWAGLSLVVAVGIVLAGVSARYFSTTGGSGADILLFLALAAVFFLLLSILMIRRLHDRNMSGWWFVVFGILPFLLYPLPLYVFRIMPQTYEAQQIANPVMLAMQIAAAALFFWGLFVLGLKPGTPGDNRFGAPPWGTAK